MRGRVLRPSAERGVRQGAFATFLGIVLEDSPLPTACRRGAGGEGVGPLPLAGRRRGRHLPDAYPRRCALASVSAANPVQFGNYPHLVGSRMPAEEVRQRQLLWADGLGQPGDRLWAMTDALAQCCLAAKENGGNPWSELEMLPARLPAAEQTG